MADPLFSYHTRVVRSKAPVLDIDVRVFSDKIAISTVAQQMFLSSPSNEKEILIKDIVQVEYIYDTELRLTFNYDGPGADAIHLWGTREELERVCEIFHEYNPNIVFDRAKKDTSLSSLQLKGVAIFAKGYLVYVAFLVFAVFLIKLVAYLTGHTLPFK
jgi:hypothetical protein